MPEHSPEPWADGMYCRHETLVDADGRRIDFDHPTSDDGHFCSDRCVAWRAEEKANRIRAAACVNALRGLNPEVVGELVAFVQKVVDVEDPLTFDETTGEFRALAKEARELLAKVKK